MKAPVRESEGIFVLAFVFFTAAAWYAVFVLGIIPEDAVVRSGQALDLLAGTDAGRQSLICSPWWPPLPALLHLPLVCCGAQIGGVPLSCLVSALCGAGMLLCLGRIFAQFGVPGPFRGVLLLAVAVHPTVLRASATGADVSLVFFLLAAVLWHLLAWIDGRRIGDFLRMTAGAALLGTAATEGAWYVAALVPLVIGVGVAQKKSGREIEALVLLFLAPAVYLVCLWFLFNWLVLGDALYFLRGWLVHRVAAPIPPCSVAGCLRSVMEYFPAFAVALCVAVVGCARRGRLFCLPAIVFSLVPLGFCGIAGAAGLLPDPVRILAPVVLLSVVLAVTAMRRDDPRPVRTAMSALIALLLIAAIPGAARMPPPAVRSVASAEIAEVESYIAMHAADARVFITDFSGYRYRFFSRRGLPVVHCFDFRPETAWKSAAAPLLVVSRPRGMAACDGIHLRYPDLYAEGSSFAVLEREFEDWRIFRIVPRP